MTKRDFTESYFRLAVVFVVLSMVALVLIYLPDFIGRGLWINFTVPLVFCAALIMFWTPVVKIIKRKWQNVPDAGYFQAVNLLALFSIISFFLIRLPGYISQADYLRMAVLMGCCLVSVIITAFLMLKVKKASDLAFWVPLSVFVIYTAGTIYMGGSYYFFLVCLIVYGIGAAYSQERRFLYFLIIAHLVTLGLILLDFPLQAGSYSREESLVKWIIMVYVSLFFLMLSSYSTEKMSRSAKAFDSFNTLMTTTPNLLALIDKNSRVTYISRPLAKLARIEDHEMASGRPLIDLFPQMSMKRLVSEVMNTNGFYEETKELYIRQESHHFKIIADDLDGSSGGKFIDITDITPIVLAKQEAERSAESKSIFLANTSHEIRTPMNAILGMTELILRNDLPDDSREKVLAIRQAGLNLMSIINDILDFSKIESGKMEIFPNEYETASLLSDVVSIISLRMTEKNLLFVTDIDCGLPKKLYGDENRLRQILLNLLSNAVKYTPAGQISFTVKGLSDECGNQQLAFKIEDTGIGIREEETGKLFDDFSRLDYRKNRGIEGTGLGLAISMNLCRLMGGDIKVESTYGQGSIFTVYLSQKIIDPSPMAKVISPQEKRVLILDERPTSLESISLSLKNLNVPFKAVSDIGFFKSALNKNIVYPFILVSAQLLGKVLLLVRESAPESQLVILSDYSGTPLSGSRRSLATPVHVISLAALLNGQERASAGQKLEYQALFAAPSASVLLVDDIETNLMVAAGLLAPYRTKVDLCSSGREAVKLVMENSYDLIFMDHMMPDVDGIEATAMIRNNSQPYFQNVPIVALTANAVQGMKEMFLNNGFNDFLPKPIEIDKFNEIMNRWIPAAKRQKPVPERDEKSPELFRIDGIDTSAGLTRTGGSIKKYQEILGVFYQDVVKRLEKLKNVPGESELLEFTTEVHALKSASASIGGLETSSLAARLEEAGRNRDLKFIRENLPLFLANLTRISQAISKVISFLNPSRKDEKDCVLDDFCLRKLKEALASQKVRAVDDIIDHLIQRSGSESKELRLISDCVLLSDFDRAQKIVEDLLKTAEG